MKRSAAMVAAALCVPLLLAGTSYGAPDPVKENLRKLKARLKSAKAQTKPAPPKAPETVRKPVRSSRSYRRSPQSSKPQVKLPPMPKLKYDLDYEKERLGTIPKTGDIRVETTNRGKVVFAYWGVYPISDKDGNGSKKNLAPANYRVMLKGPSMARPWIRYVQVKPDMVAVLKVELPEGN